MTTRQALLASLLLFGVVLAFVPVCRAEDYLPVRVSVTNIDDAPNKPAWIKAADLDGDGIAEVVVSSYEADKLLLLNIRPESADSEHNP